MELKKEKNGHKDDCIQDNGCSYHNSIKDISCSVFAEIAKNWSDWSRKGSDIDKRDQNRVEEHQ